MMPREAVLPFALFVALVLCTALSALAASGHFPHRYRAPSLRCGLGRAILFGACGLAALALVIGGAAAWRLMPWPAAVIGGGAAILAAPLVLRPLPDRFVNGRAGLLAFTGAAVLLALALAALTW
jgi:hypothetical protein